MKPATSLVAFACLLAGIAGTGCFTEAIDAKLVVSDGETYTVSTWKHVRGSVVVEAGGRLEVVQGRLVVDESLVVHGEMVVREGAAVEFRATEEHGNLRVVDGRLEVHSSYLTSVNVLSIVRGEVNVTDGEIAGGAILLDGGRASIIESSLILSGGRGPYADNLSEIQVLAGDLRVESTSIDDAELSVADGVRARLIGVGIHPLRVSGEGVVEAGWPLRVRVQEPDGTRVANVTTVVRSVPLDDMEVDRGVTDAFGTVTLDAIEYVLSGNTSKVRSGNPHRIEVPDRGAHTVGVSAQGMGEATVVVVPV